MKKGKTFTLKTKVTTTGSISKKLTFKTRNKSVATVSSKGKITAKKKGTAKITVSSKANSKKKVTITVTVGTPVTKVTMSAKKATIGVGTTKKLSVTLAPKTPSNKKVVWSTSNKKIATVDSKGNVKGVKAGTATITATAADGSGKKATCKVTVKKAVTKVKLDETKMNLGVGKSKTLKATVTPEKALSDVKWTTSDKKVATVSSTGKVKGIKAGTATITATATDGSGKKATCKVTVKKAVTKVKLNKTELNLFVGKSETLKTTVTPEKAFGDVEWTTSNKEIATVSSTGKVKAIKAGTATITATATDGSGKKATCKVVVTTPVESVALSETAKTVKKGEVFSLTATVTPEKATDKAVEWSSSDENVALVTAKGKVSAVGAGTATITAASADGSGKKAACTVTVVEEAVIVSAATPNKITIVVTMSEAMDLKAEQFSVMTKPTMQGTYETALVIGSVTASADKLTYTIKLDKKNRMKDGWFVKAAVTGIRGTEQAEIETYYSDGNDTSTWNYYFDYNVGQDVRETIFTPPDIKAGIAVENITAGTLPEGLTWKQSKDQERDIIIYGTPAKAGNYSTILSCTYEDGTVVINNIAWNISVPGGITGYVEPMDLLLDNVDELGKFADVDINIYQQISDGSGFYTYAFENGNGQGLEISADGYVSGRLREAKDYLIKVVVTDAHNPAISTVIPIEIHVSGGIEVTGRVKNPQGNGIAGAMVSFSEEERIFSMPCDPDGTYRVVIPAGTYDIEASHNGARESMYSQTFTASQDHVDFTLPVYPVKVASGNTSVTPENFGSWQDAAGEYYGGGETLYLASGTYHLQTEGVVNGYQYTASIQVTVADQPVTVTASVTGKAVNLTELTLDEPQTITTTEGKWFKFVPKENGTYYFYSSNNAGNPEGYLYDSWWNEQVHDDAGRENNNFRIEYPCYAGEVYYLKAQPCGTGSVTMDVVVSMTDP